MSHQATAWALYEVPRDLIDDSARFTLLALADQVDSHGRGAVLTAEQLADLLDRDERSIKRHLAKLQATGLISEGDQRLVAYLPRNRRPRVWDLTMTARADLLDQDTPVTPPPGVTRVTPRGDTAGEAGPGDLVPAPAPLRDLVAAAATRHGEAGTW